MSSDALLGLNQWALGGDWTVRSDAVVLNAANGRIVYRFHARDLLLVMTRGVQKGPVPFRVLIDGSAPGAAHGADVDEQGNGVVGEPRMYQLIRQTRPIVDHQFEIESSTLAWRSSCLPSASASRVEWSAWEDPRTAQALRASIAEAHSFRELWEIRRHRTNSYVFVRDYRRLQIRKVLELYLQGLSFLSPLRHRAARPS